MKKSIRISFLLFSLLLAQQLKAQLVLENFTDIKSPGGLIKVEIKMNEGELRYSILHSKEMVIENSRLGLVREDADFSKSLKWVKSSPRTVVKDDYRILTAKKSSIHYKANRKIISVAGNNGEAMQIVFQVSDDGVAFRYVFPGKSVEIKKISEEVTGFRFPVGTMAWMQPKTEAQSGWEHTNPSYEAHYQMNIPVGTAAPGTNGWVYPAMFRVQDTWVLLTEAALGRTYCGTGLQQFSEGREYKVSFPQAPEKFTNGVLLPQSTLPWQTPWRIITIGSLKTIAESTLGTDLALPAKKMDASFIKPGRASWSWIMSKDDFIVYDEQKKYINYAADMGWEYCLIDADWDRKIGYDKIKELADYAATKKVGLLLWYNSAGDWNTVKYTPKDKLLSHASRVKEFSLLQEMGIKGVKIDFFAGDGQSMINYYQDILEDAGTHHLLVNFHGATLPRGWHRTYPNLMTTEAVYGYEMITFNQKDADLAPAHMVMSAFARNAFDPMDFTPVSLHKIPKINRVTTPAFELATSVIFLSGIQHFVEGPAGMEKMPATVKQFMRDVPVAWDEVKFLDGLPGEFYVVGRRAGQKWYVAGINANKEDKKVSIDFSFLNSAKKGRLFFSRQGEVGTKTLSLTMGRKESIVISPNDGFVIVIE